MVSLESLKPRSASDEVTEYGFICTNCDQWEHSHYENKKLRHDLSVLDKMDVKSPKFARKWDKSRRKFENLQERMRKRKG